MSLPVIRPGQTLKVVSAYKRNGQVMLKAGAVLRADRVSETGNVIVSGHGGYFRPDRFEVMS